jgi:hypothetical protein
MRGVGGRGRHEEAFMDVVPDGITETVLLSFGLLITQAV